MRGNEQVTQWGDDMNKREKIQKRIHDLIIHSDSSQSTAK